MNTDSHKLEQQGSGGVKLIGNHKKAVAERADHLRDADFGFDVLVLVAVEKEFGLGFRDVVVERHEARVDFIFLVVNEARRVVAEKNIHGREFLHEPCHVALLTQVVPARLVFPRAAEATKRHAAERKGFNVEVANGRGERRTPIVVAFDRKDFSATTPSRDSQNRFVWQIAQRKEDVSRVFRNVPRHVLVVRDDEESHRAALGRSNCRQNRVQPRCDEMRRLQSLGQDFDGGDKQHGAERDVVRAENRRIEGNVADRFERELPDHALLQDGGNHDSSKGSGCHKNEFENPVTCVAVSVEGALSDHKKDCGSHNDNQKEGHCSAAGDSKRPCCRRKPRNPSLDHPTETEDKRERKEKSHFSPGTGQGGNYDSGNGADDVRENHEQHCVFPSQTPFKKHESATLDGDGDEQPNERLRQTGKAGERSASEELKQGQYRFTARAAKGKANGQNENPCKRQWRTFRQSIHSHKECSCTLSNNTNPRGWFQLEKVDCG